MLNSASKQGDKKGVASVNKNQQKVFLLSVRSVSFAREASVNVEPCASRHVQLTGKLPAN